MHDYAARVMGAGFLALGITSGRANNCHTEDDKKSVLLSHGLVSCFTFTSELYTQVFLIVMNFSQIFVCSFIVCIFCFMTGQWSLLPNHAAVPGVFQCVFPVAHIWDLCSSAGYPE